MVAGALADALAFAHEGRDPGPVEGLDVGSVSDDTQLTLATALGLIAAGGEVDPEAIGQQFVQWHREHGLRGIGAATAKAVRELSFGGHWALVGRKGEMAAGNGAAIRVAPLAFALDPHDKTARRSVRDVSRITHHSDEAYVGALAICIAVHDGATGAWDGGRDIFELLAAVLPDTRVNDRIREFVDLSDATIPQAAEQFGASGYVVEAVPLALHAACRGGRVGFTQMIQEIIEAGGDCDSIGSMAAQCFGAVHGDDAVPSDLLALLDVRAEVEETSAKLFKALQKRR